MVTQDPPRIRRTVDVRAADIRETDWMTEPEAAQLAPSLTQPSATAVAMPAASQPMARVRRVAKSWALLLVVLALPSLGLPGLLRKLIDDSGVLTVLQTIWVTLPLTLAVAVIAYRLFARRSLKPFGLTLVVAAALLAIGAIGLASGRRAFTELLSPEVVPCLDANSPCLQSPDESTLALPIKVLATYWHFYGVVGFFSAIVIGIFAGWSLSVLLGRR
jgi:hypothetical protein